MSNLNVTKVLEQGQELLLIYGVRVLSAIAILIIGRIAAGIIRSIIRRSSGKANVEATVSNFSANLAYIAIMAFVIIAGLGRLGVQTTSFVALIGAAGLAIGLAFQGSLANFASGFLMILFRPFKVGDFIEGAGISGFVKEIEVFTTTVITPDNKKIIIPNAKLTGNHIINYTAEDTRRIDLVFGVSYTDNIDTVKRVIADVCNNYSGILNEPETQIALSELADSSVNFVVRPWVKTDDYWNVRFGLTEAMKKRFDKEGISIPFPQNDIHLYSEKK